MGMMTDRASWARRLPSAADTSTHAWRIHRQRQERRWYRALVEASRESHRREARKAHAQIHSLAAALGRLVKLMIGEPVPSDDRDQLLAAAKRALRAAAHEYGLEAVSPDYALPLIESEADRKARETVSLRGCS